MRELVCNAGDTQTARTAQTFPAGLLIWMIFTAAMQNCGLINQRVSCTAKETSSPQRDLRDTLESPAEKDSPLLRTPSEASLYQFLTGSLPVPSACQLSVLLSALVLVVPAPITLYHSCHGEPRAELTWCPPAAAARRHGAAGSRRPPRHPGRGAGCEPGR